MRVRVKTEGNKHQMRQAISREVRAKMPPELRRSEEGKPTFKWEPYVRETIRYGGDEGIRVAEKIFEGSTRSCFKMLEKVRTREEGFRVSRSFLSMIGSLPIFFSSVSDCEKMMRAYRDGYVELMSDGDKDQEVEITNHMEKQFERRKESFLRHGKTVWKYITEGKDLTEGLDEYLDVVRENKRDVERKALGGLVEDNEEQWVSVIGSYMHMHNNRLGFSIPNEAYLAHAAMRVAQDIQG